MGKNERTKEILNSIVNNNNSAVYQRQQVYKLASINLPSLKFKKLIARKKKIFCKFIESSFMRDKSSKKKKAISKNKQATNIHTQFTNAKLFRWVFGIN